MKKKASYLKYLVNRYKIDILAIVLALAMIVAGIFIGNCPYPFWDSIKWVCVAENLVRDVFGEAEDKNDAYFVNVGYDKQIVEVQVIPAGTGRAEITDRKVLLDFLTIAEQAHYKYIFLDIRFEKGYNTEWDAALFSKIASMRDIVFAHHYEVSYTDGEDSETNGFEIADSTLLPKAAYNDYYTTIFSSNFTRYQYLQDGRPSVALRMYQDIDGKTVEEKGLLYFNEGTPCENCPYIPIKGTIRAPSGDGTAADYYNLGPFLMTLPKEELIQGMNGKIVVIGDFVEDNHDTYMGMLPGSYLTYIAYKYLAHGRNKVSIAVSCFMFLVFFFIFRTKIRGRIVFPWGEKILQLRIMGWLRCLMSWHFIRFVGRFVSYSFILSIICAIVYLVSGYTFNVMLPALVITFIGQIKDSLKTKTI